MVLLAFCLTNHSSKSFTGFTKSLRKIVNQLGDSTGEVSKPHLSLFYNFTKLKKELANGLPTTSIQTPFKGCLY